MDCRPPGTSVHGILQARILEWMVISFSRGSFQPRERIRVSCVCCTASVFLTTEPPGVAIKPTEGVTLWVCVHLCFLVQCIMIYCERSGFHVGESQVSFELMLTCQRCLRSRSKPSFPIWILTLLWTAHVFTPTWSCRTCSKSESTLTRLPQTRRGEQDPETIFR